MTVARAEVGNWLDGYRMAWQQQDADLVTALFSADARYAVNPFDHVLNGRAAIEEYWSAGAAGSQTDIVFDYELWAVDGNTATAHWTASFTRTRTGERVHMDGVFRLAFARDESRGLICKSLDEWWFLSSDAAGPGGVDTPRTD
ncbi:MAG: nuclear transport factor 2 family protein [Pseudomonadota bacterium]